MDERPQRDRPSGAEEFDDEQVRDIGGTDEEFEDVDEDIEFDEDLDEDLPPKSER